MIGAGVIFFIFDAVVNLIVSTIIISPRIKRAVDDVPWSNPFHIKYMTLYQAGAMIEFSYPRTPASIDDKVVVMLFRFVNVRGNDKADGLQIWIGTTLKASTLQWVC